MDGLVWCLGAAFVFAIALVAIPPLHGKRKERGPSPRPRVVKKL